LPLLHTLRLYTESLPASVSVLSGLQLERHNFELNFPRLKVLKPFISSPTPEEVEGLHHAGVTELGLG